VNGTDARVALCIPVYDEVEALRRLLVSIADVDYPPDLLQVVVAVDGGDPAVRELAEAAGARTVVLSPNQGSYAARNAAIDAVDGAVDAVLFTDADCTVSRQWVRAHLAALETADLSGGGVRWAFSERPSPAEWVDSIRHLHQRAYVERDHYAATCNLAVRASVLDTMRFDATLRTGGDAEFGRRATAAGFSLVYTDDAAVRHLPRRTRRDLMTKVHRIAKGVPQQRARWVERGVLPSARLTRGPWRRARAAGLDVGPVWGLRACLLDWLANVLFRRAVRRTLSEAVR
jgi:glycosyltransferase involved in cell wall biosynthesis